MLKVFDAKRKTKIGNFKSIVEIAEFLEKKYKKRGEFYVIPPHCTSVFSIKKITYDEYGVNYEGSYY